jgi:hypothetical protein
MIVCRNMRWVLWLWVFLFVLPGPAWTRPPRPSTPDPIRGAMEELKKIEKNESTALLRGQLNEKIGNLERAKGRTKKAVLSYRHALDAFASGGLAEERDRLLKELSRKGRNWPQKTAVSFDGRQKAWEKMESVRSEAKKLERHSEPPAAKDPKVVDLQKQVDAIFSVGNRERDQELLAQAKWVQGRIAATLGDADSEIRRYREGAELCANGVCPKTRRRLLAMTAEVLEIRGEPEEAFRIAASLNAEKMAGSEEPARKHVRSKAMVRLCQSIRAKGGASCREIEKKAVGFVTYRDFSDDPEQPELTPEMIQEVHEEYTPLLGECLYEAAKKGEAEPGSSFELDWTVRNDGRVDFFTVTPTIDGTGLHRCLQEAIQWFRYPRYLGERRNVILPLSVSP